MEVYEAQPAVRFVQQQRFATTLLSYSSSIVFGGTPC